VGGEDHRPGGPGLAADHEGAGEHVPHLREIVVVDRMMRAGLEPEDAGVGFGRPLRPRMEQHFSGLTGPADRLPINVVAMADLAALMTLPGLNGGHGCPLSLVASAVFPLGRALLPKNPPSFPPLP